MPARYKDFHSFGTPSESLGRLTITTSISGGVRMFDSKKMFDLGFAFLNAGEANFQEGAIRHRSDYQNVAGVVNLAFACELFLKCLLNMAGLETRGYKHEHKIEALWSKYKNTSGNDASQIETSVMNQLVTDFTFEEMLHNDSNVFYNYRYFYEPDHLSAIKNNPLRPQFLRILAKELYDSLYNRPMP